jgi:UDP-3-O-[3-hydroxymyristoyl] glucosamine N-acyltransferase
MKMKLKDIAELVEGTVEGNGELLVANIATLGDASAEDIAVFFDPKLEGELLGTKACAVVVQENMKGLEVIMGKIKRPVIKTSNPKLAMLRLLEKYYPTGISDVPSGVHASVIMGNGTKLGKDVSIGPYTVIEKNVIIGGKCVIQANCYIGSGVIMGEGCFVYANTTIREKVVMGSHVIIHSGAVIGSDGYGYVTLNGKHRKIPHIGMVNIGDDVEIGANVAIDRGTMGKTVIGSGTKIDNLVHIAHNVSIGKNCLILGQVGIGGSTEIGDNVTMASQSGVIDHAVVGDGAIIAAKTGAIKDVKPGEIVTGFPARPHKEFLKIQASMTRLPELVKLLRKKETEK